MLCTARMKTPNAIYNICFIRDEITIRVRMCAERKVDGGNRMGIS